MIEPLDVSLERGKNGRWNETPMCVRVVAVEAAIAPDAIADIHQEAVEVVDLVPWVHSIESGVLSGTHSTFECTLVGRQDRAEA